MTTPVTGPISFSDITSARGAGGPTIANMDWLRTNTKDGIKDLNSARNRQWYQAYADTRAWLQAPGLAMDCAPSGDCSGGGWDCSDCAGDCT
jgi:hypothetical protein